MKAKCRIYLKMKILLWLIFAVRLENKNVAQTISSFFGIFLLIIIADFISNVTYDMYENLLENDVRELPFLSLIFKKVMTAKCQIYSKVKLLMQ